MARIEKNESCLRIKEQFANTIGKSNGISILCGAGISTNSGLPLANRMIEQILRTCESNPEEHRVIIQSGLPFEAFMGTLQDITPIDTILRVFELGEPNYSHHWIANLFISGSVTTIVTTNQDMLLENALDQRGFRPGRDYQLIFEERDFSLINWTSESPRLIKLHGSFESLESMAITMKNVAGKVHSESRGNAIENLFSRGKHTSVLVLGYSFSDSFDICPQIEGITGEFKNVLIIEHFPHPGYECIENIRLRNDNNPFKKRGIGYRMYCDTDKLLHEFRDFNKEAPNIRPSQLSDVNFDKILSEWKTKTGDNFDVISNYFLGSLLFDIDLPHMAESRLNVALSLAQKKGNGHFQSKCLSMLAGITHDRQTAIRLLEEGLRIASIYNDSEQQADCLCSLVAIHGALGETNKALENCQKGIELVRKTGDKNREARILANEGGLLGSKQAYNEALKRLSDALTLSRETGDKAAEGQALVNFGIVYRALGNTSQALEYLNSALIALQPFLVSNHRIIVSTKKLIASTFNWTFEYDHRHDSFKAKFARHLRQMSLLVVLGCFLFCVRSIFMMLTRSSDSSLVVTLVPIVVSAVIGALVIYGIVRLSYLPTTEQVATVVEDIRQSNYRGIESHKAELHFFFPPHWKTQKVGKEGWVLRPKGLGFPISIGVWVTEQIEKFSDNSFEGMVRNVQDLAQREGGTIDLASICPRRIAGIDGIQYMKTHSRNHQMLGFFWTFKGGDFQIVIHASSRQHIEIIRPAIDAFLVYCYMR